MNTQFWSSDALTADHERHSGDVEREIAATRLAMRPCSKRIWVRENGESHMFKVTRKGVGPLDTKHGRFHLFYFEIDDLWREYYALVKAQLDDDFMPVFNSNSLFMRIDSGCVTGQVFLDRTCECREQLEQAMADVSAEGDGLIVHIPRQDGRGMGLPFKLATLALQEKLGLDTVEAARVVAGSGYIDSRTYAGVVAILRFFGISNCGINLATNNPKKEKVFLENSYRLSARSIVIGPTAHTARHLLAKQQALGHRNLVPAGAAG